MAKYQLICIVIGSLVNSFNWIKDCRISSLTMILYSDYLSFHVLIFPIQWAHINVTLVDWNGRVSKIQGMDLEITTAAALRGHSRGHSSPKKITALPSNRMVNTSIELINTSIELINTSIELINTSIETYVALAFSFMHALNIMFTSPQAITQSLAVML